MQQQTFLNALGSIESSVEMINAAYHRIDILNSKAQDSQEHQESQEPELKDRSCLEKLFIAVCTIKKEFYKKVGESFSMVDINTSKQDVIAASIKDPLSFIEEMKSSIELEMDHITSKPYLISDSGVKVSLETNLMKKAKKTILDCLKKL